MRAGAKASALSFQHGNKGFAKMKTYVQPGKTVTLEADDDYDSGDVIVINDIIGICSTSVETGDDVEVALVGVFDLPKDDSTGSSIDQGERVYWNATDSVVETDSTAANTLLGVATEDAADGDTTVRVRLNGSF
jgi:predicted RecA/RadA family phage recombinase